MVVDFRGFQVTTDNQPRYGSTAIIRGVLHDPATSGLLLDIGGVYSLWANGLLVIDAAPLDPDPAMGPGYLIAIIPHTVLMTRGEYKWELTVTDATTGFTGTDQGRFRV